FYGRFTIPDWADKPTEVPYAEFVNPHSLNQYAYVKNNQQTYDDPSGHDGEIMDFLSGMARGYTASATMGVSGAREPSDSAASKVGQVIGSAAETLQGLDTFSGGAGLTGASLAAEGPSLGISTAGAAVGAVGMGIGSEMMAGGVANLMRMAQGGTYVLQNPETGDVERSGRTNDLE